MADSNKASSKGKPNVPAKPYADFPLFAHQTGRWAKKIRGKIRFYGRWGRTVAGKVVPVEDVDASAAEAKLEFDRCWPHHSQGREAPAADGIERDYLTINDLVNGFLANKEGRIATKELSAHTYSEYHRICGTLIQHFGKTKRVDDLQPIDFESLRRAFAKGCNLVTLKSKVNRARVVFKYAYDTRLIDKPVDFGKSFDRPKPMKLREAKNEAGQNMFTHDELITILAALDGESIAVPGEEKPVKRPASPVMKAMVLLGLNAGFGNTDCATIPRTAFDLKKGWLTYPRPKTAIQRRIPLWPETVAAVNAALPLRPDATDPEDDGLCFLTERGSRFVRIQTSKNNADRHVVINSLSRSFEQLIDALKVGQRRGVNFYTLRHVFETIGGGSRDQIAVDAIMGHIDSSMGANYREYIEDERLIAVVNHVRAWLWPEASNK